MTQPDMTLYTKMVKKQRDLDRRNGGSKLSNTSGANLDDKIKVMNMDPEEKQEVVRDFAHSILLRSGSTGGNKNLFVNSKEAFMQLPKAKSPMGMTTMSNSKTGFFAATDPSATDYKTLKKNERASKVFDKARSSSISIMRIERELSPKKRRGSPDSTAAMKAETLIRDLVAMDENHENERM